jgi:hypothetical protein
MIGTGSTRRGLVLGGATLALLGATCADAMASNGCRTVGARAKVESFAFKTDLAYMYVTKRFCWNGSRVTRVSPPDVTPDVTKAGDYSGWEWQGPVYTRHRYYTKDGRPRGGHFTWVIGKFRQQIGSYRKTVHVWVKLWGYYYGGARTDRRNS